MAAPTFQAAGAGVSTSGASISVAWPTHQIDDVAILLLETTGGQGFSGGHYGNFIKWSTSNTGTGTSGTRLTVMWARATSSSMPNVTINNPGDHVYGVILTFRGVTGKVPIEAALATVKGTASTSLSMGGVDTLSPNTLVVYAASRDNDNASAHFSSWSNATLTSFGEIFDGGTTDGNGGGIGVAAGTKATAGASGTTTATISNSVVNAYIRIVLRSEQDKRYWVGGSGDVDDTSHWSYSSGGSPGARVPTAYEQVYFDSNSFSAGGQTVTLDTFLDGFSIDWTGVTNNPTLAVDGAVYVSGGDLTLVPGMTLSNGSSFKNWEFYSYNAPAGTTHTIDFGGHSIDAEYVSFSGEEDSTYSLGSSLISVTPDGMIEIFNVAFTTNNYDISAVDLNIYNPGVLNAGTSHITATSDIWFYDSPGTYNTSNCTLSITGSSVSGGDLTVPTGSQFKAINISNTSTVNLTRQTCTVENLTVSAGTEVSVSDGTGVITITGVVSLLGTNSDPIVISASEALSGDVFYHSPTTIKAYNLSLTDITVTGGAAWYAYNSTDNGGNTGWIFADATDYETGGEGFLTLY